MNEENKKVVLTCAQPTGKLHLGNYLGAIKYWVDLSNKEECYFGIADMHAITVPYTPADLRKNVYDCLAQYLACGLNPESAIFPQSAVHGHSDLAWVLACLCPVGALERMTQFKDKAKKQTSFIGSGLLYYPVLMASDILLYNADIVPVGEDQKQHMELARDLAQKFNLKYSDTFKVPEASIPKAGARIMSLQNPESKMSKSDKNQNAVVYVVDEPTAIKKKLMGAVTDSDSCVRFDAENKKGIANLMNIYSAITAKSYAEIENEFAGKGYGDFKSAVADALIAHLAPVREKYLSLINDKAYLESVFESGIQKAQYRANKILGKVWRKAGFYQAPKK